MIKAIKYFALCCDNCGAYWADNEFREDKECMGVPTDDPNWFTALQSAQALQEALDEDVKWYTDEKENCTLHYCPKCYTISKDGELRIMFNNKQNLEQTKYDTEDE